MVAVRVNFEGDRVGQKFQRGMLRNRDAVLASTRGAVDKVMEEGLEKGRENIRGAGNFQSARWIQGLRARKGEGGGNIRVDFTHDVPYFMVHQRGAVIKGKPLLWIPFVGASDAKGVYARDYPGRLFRVTSRRGTPILMAEGGVPKYSGHASVKIPKRFRVIEILREVTNKMGEFYNKILNSRSGADGG